MEEFKRLISLIGIDNYNKLANKKIAIFGLGGIGSNVLSSLVRTGIDSFVLVDYDIVEPSNFNRQKIANYTTLGLKKTDAAYHLMKKINNNLSCKLYDLKIDKDTIHKVDLKDVCYIVDAVDDLEAKLAILMKAKELNISNFYTTLLVSPYKDSVKIKELANYISSENKLNFISLKFNQLDLSKKSNKLAKLKGFYCQKYCGCEFSKK